MDTSHQRGSPERGQVLVLVALALTALLALTGLVIDGGNAWAQERQTQNGSDSAAEAGSVILAQWFAGASAPSTAYPASASCTSTNQWDLAVCQAVYGAAKANGVAITAAYYTKYDGSQNLGTVGGGSLPSGAQGIRAVGNKQFGTYLAGVVGINQMSAGAQATAIVGTVTTYCPTGTICAALPVTFPVQTSTCAGNGTLQVGNSPWSPTTDFTAGTESIVPLCKNGSGSVGWLQWPCETTNGTTGLIAEITNPCLTNITLPAWVPTYTGNTNDPAVQTALNNYHNQLVYLPEFNDVQGTGANLQYHIYQFQAFELDTAYISGNNHPECNTTPGLPPVDGNGSNGCIKGWFTDAIVTGAVNIGSITPGTTQTLGVQLIK